MEKESVSLYQTKGSTDKEYHCHLDQVDGGWMVYGRNGRRGAALAHQAKTATPLPHAEAKAIYDSLVRSKLKGGYSPLDAGVPYQGTELESAFTGVLPQLLNPIPEERARKLLQDDGWLMQEKDDGHRRMVTVKAPGELVGSKRNGFPVPLPLGVVDALSGLPAGTILDGEALPGPRLSIFDILALGPRPLQALGFEERHALLSEALEDGASVSVSPLYKGTAAKTEAFERIRQKRGEGVVFRKNDASYAHGRPASGGNALKHVFYETSTFVVEQVAKGKRSVHLAVFDASGAKVDMGKVSISSNAEIPALGALVDVRYLYAHPDGKLHISTYKGVRDDLDISACTTAQLKYKADDALDEGEEEGEEDGEQEGEGENQHRDQGQGQSQD
jgi:bifunctional non-homologous end joining protein LigD